MKARDKIYDVILSIVKSIGVYTVLFTLNNMIKGRGKSEIKEGGIPQTHPAKWI